MCDDIKLAFDKRMGTALIMIDLSAAFDTINHDILLRRLRDRYGIMGDALKWGEILFNKPISKDFNKRIHLM